MSAPDVAELPRAGEVEFVVADVGAALLWIPIADRFRFWNSEVKQHLADLNQNRLETRTPSG